MKIKCIIILSSMLLLSGCSASITNTKYYNNADIEATAFYEIPDKKTEIQKLTDYSTLNREYWTDTPNSKKPELPEGFEKIDNISMTQSIHNGKIELYKSQKFDDVMYAYDNSFFVAISTPKSYPQKYKTSINSIMDKSNLYADNYSIGNSRDMLSFSNKEFIIAENLSNSVFSLDYYDVKLISDNAPLKVMVFLDNGEVKRIHIMSLKNVDEEYMNNGIDDIEAVLSNYDIDAEEILAQYIADDSIKDYKKELKNCTIQKLIAPFANNSRYLTNFIITLE